MHMQTNVRITFRFRITNSLKSRTEFSSMYYRKTNSVKKSIWFLLKFHCQLLALSTEAHYKIDKMQQQYAQKLTSRTNLGD